MTVEHLSELDWELLELCSMSPETTTALHEEMLESSLDRDVVESALHGLVARGLMVTYRDVYGGVHRPRGGDPESRVYEDDWWQLTAAGEQTVRSR